MTDERKAKLYDSLLEWVDEHCPTDDDFERALFHLGFTEVEVIKARLERDESAVVSELVERASMVFIDIINELSDKIELRPVVDDCLANLDPALDVYANLDRWVSQAIVNYLI